MCPNSISLISEYLLTNLDFLGLPWNLKVMGLGAPLSITDDEDFIIDLHKKKESHYDIGKNTLERENYNENNWLAVVIGKNKPKQFS